MQNLQLAAGFMSSMIFVWCHRKQEETDLWLDRLNQTFNPSSRN